VDAADEQADILITPRAIVLALDRHSRLAHASARPDPANGALAVTIGAGALTVEERPSLDGNAVRFIPVGLSVNGSPVSGSIPQGIAADAAFTVAFPPLPVNLEPQSVRVERSGIAVTASGGPATFGPGHRTPAQGTC